MAGNKNSGRKGGLTNAEADFRMKTISKMWRMIDDAISNPSLDIEYRLELCKIHTVKSIPTEISGNLGVQVTKMPAIQKEYPSGEAKTENRIAEFLIGSPDTSENT